MHLQEVAPDQLFDAEKNKGAGHGPDRRAKASEQGHDDRFDRVQNVVDVGRLDVVDPAGIQRAGHGDEHSRQREGQAFVQG